mmetsp:Transcript_31556/g.49419  ORF Transcript_31556/g.49419 Transcript_31556/m.49419 type:complete len:171 (-) Transcript_31556:1285-1797(-)
MDREEKGGVIVEGNDACVALEFDGPQQRNGQPGINLSVGLGRTLQQAEFFLDGETFEVIKCSAPIFSVLMAHVMKGAEAEGLVDMKSGCQLAETVLLPLKPAPAPKGAPMNNGSENRKSEDDGTHFRVAPVPPALRLLSFPVFVYHSVFQLLGHSPPSILILLGRLETAY